MKNFFFIQYYSHSKALLAISGILMHCLANRSFELMVQPMQMNSTGRLIYSISHIIFALGK